jgi:hypothetical protein
MEQGSSVVQRWLFIYGTDFVFVLCVNTPNNTGFFVCLLTPVQFTNAARLRAPKAFTFGMEMHLDHIWKQSVLMSEKKMILAQFLSILGGHTAARAFMLHVSNFPHPVFSSSYFFKNCRQVSAFVRHG